MSQPLPSLASLYFSQPLVTSAYITFSTSLISLYLPETQIWLFWNATLVYELSAPGSGWKHTYNGVDLSTLNLCPNLKGGLDAAQQPHQIPLIHSPSHSRGRSVHTFPFLLTCQHLCPHAHSQERTFLLTFLTKLEQIRREFPQTHTTSSTHLQPSAPIPAAFFLLWKMNSLFVSFSTASLFLLYWRIPNWGRCVWVHGWVWLYWGLGQGLFSFCCCYK